MSVSDQKVKESRTDLFGFYRAKVTEVDIESDVDGIKNAYGQIRLFVPFYMTDKDPNFDEDRMGVLGYPANSPMGGRNDKDIDKESFYQGTVYVPRKGSWVWCFFEGGNENKCYYMGSIDIENTMLPPENRNKDATGAPMDEPHRSYTILKTSAGRSIIVCDSEDCARIEITGKKANLTDGEDTGPEGDDASAFDIDDNMTTILLDERTDSEKILIRSHKGDFINFDINDQSLQISIAGDIHVKNTGELHWHTVGDAHIVIDGNVYTKVGASKYLTVGEDHQISVGKSTSNQSADLHTIDASSDVPIQSGQSVVAKTPSVVDPEGERDT